MPVIKEPQGVSLVNRVWRCALPEYTAEPAYSVLTWGSGMLDRHRADAWACCRGIETPLPHSPTAEAVRPAMGASRGILAFRRCEPVTGGLWSTSCQTPCAAMSVRSKLLVFRQSTGFDLGPQRIWRDSHCISFDVSVCFYPQIILAPLRRGTQYVMNLYLYLLGCVSYSLLAICR